MSGFPLSSSSSPPRPGASADRLRESRSDPDRGSCLGPPRRSGAQQPGVPPGRGPLRDHALRRCEQSLRPGVQRKRSDQRRPRPLLRAGPGPESLRGPRRPLRLRRLNARPPRPAGVASQLLLPTSSAPALAAFRLSSAIFPRWNDSIAVAKASDGKIPLSSSSAARAAVAR